MNIKKLIAFGTALMMIGCLAGCSGSNGGWKKANAKLPQFEKLADNTDEFRFVPEELKTKLKHQKKVDSFDSEISVGYQNEDETYSLYLFSSPIRYKKGSSGFCDIDDRLAAINNGKFWDKGYRYRSAANSILCYYPMELSDSQGVLVNSYFYDMRVGVSGSTLRLKSKKQLKTMWGDTTDVLTYQRGSNDFDIQAYATKAGTRMEALFDRKPKENKISFSLDSTTLTAGLTEGGYVLLRDGTELQGIIQRPILKSRKDGRLYLNNDLDVETDKGRTTITVTLDKDALAEGDQPLALDMSFEMDRRKLPDSAVYSDGSYSYNNQYLSAAASIGNLKPFGVGRLYSRIRIHQYITDDPENVQSAVYGAYNLSDSKEANQICLYHPEKFWSSTQAVWSNQVPCGKALAEQSVSHQGYYYFDVTGVIKECLSKTDYACETNGVLLKAKDETHQANIFATSDHALYPTFVEITFKKMPKTFDAYMK